MVSSRPRHYKGLNNDLWLSSLKYAKTRQITAAKLKRSSKGEGLLTIKTCLEKSSDHVTFLEKLLLGGLDLHGGELINIESLDDLILAILAGRRVREEQSLLDSVRPVTRNSHGHPAVASA